MRINRVIRNKSERERKFEKSFSSWSSKFISSHSLIVSIISGLSKGKLLEKPWKFHSWCKIIVASNHVNAHTPQNLLPIEFSLKSFSSRTKFPLYRFLLFDKKKSFCGGEEGSSADFLCRAAVQIPRGRWFWKLFGFFQSQHVIDYFCFIELLPFGVSIERIFFQSPVNIFLRRLSWLIYGHIRWGRENSTPELRGGREGRSKKIIRHLRNFNRYFWKRKEKFSPFFERMWEKPRSTD